MSLFVTDPWACIRACERVDTAVINTDKIADSGCSFYSLYFTISSPVITTVRRVHFTDQRPYMARISGICALPPPHQGHGPLHYTLHVASGFALYNVPECCQVGRGRGVVVRHEASISE